MNQLPLKPGMRIRLKHARYGMRNPTTAMPAGVTAVVLKSDGYFFHLRFDDPLYESWQDASAPWFLDTDDAEVINADPIDVLIDEVIDS